MFKPTVIETMTSSIVFWKTNGAGPSSPWRYEHFDENGLYRFAIQLDLEAPLEKHREMFGQGRAHLILERIIGKVPGDAVV